MMLMLVFTVRLNATSDCAQAADFSREQDVLGKKGAAPAGETRQVVAG